MKGRWRRLLPFVWIGAPVLLMVLGLGYVVWRALAMPVQQQKSFIQQVQLIRPPLPPPEQAPPPPPPEVDEPPPPDEVADDKNEPPPGELLGLDAEGAAGSDAFGLAARKGGRDLIGGDSDERFARYAGILKSDLASRLADNQKIRRDRYSVAVRLWVAPDGRVEKVTLDSSTGNRDLDRSIESALASVQRVSEAPPADLPQPIRLRLVSRS